MLFQNLTKEILFINRVEVLENVAQSIMDEYKGA